ncbi:MAG: hypothetical protein AAGH89_15880, partial [Verrucomicrobiota bacterium]
PQSRGFFCGAGGMSFGLQEAGLRVIAGIDQNKSRPKGFRRLSAYRGYFVRPQPPANQKNSETLYHQPRER